MGFIKNRLVLVLVGILAILLVAGIWFVSVRNSFVMMSESIDNNWAQVENQLQRRYDLIPNLVNTVKGYATHEKELFTSIAESRSKLAGARTPEQKMKASGQMESALSRLLVVVEQYPVLKANASFNRLMDELSGTENRLSVERRRFNDSIMAYNKSIKLFPKSIVASFAGYNKKEYFQIEDVAQKNIKVEF